MYEMGDIVRFTPNTAHEDELFGLYEVTGESADGDITVTNNECNSEFYADGKDLILVCTKEERRDI